MRRAGLAFVIASLWLLALSPALPCTLCPGMQNAAPLRQDLANSKLVLFGTLANPKLNAGGGSVDLQIESVLKNDPVLAGKKTVTLPRYVPVDAKNPPKYLVFCDVARDQIDPYRPMQVRSAAIVDYLRGAAGIDPKDRSAALLYFFRYLDHADPDIAGDAYLEFAKANDAEIGAVARQLDPEKLRRLVNDPQTPAPRMGLYSFLLGACGGEREATFLRSLLEKPTERTVSAMDGILAGYIQLRPREGWEFAVNTLKDGKKPFTERDAVLRTLRFFHGAKGEDHRREILQGLGALLPSEMGDLAMEDLRRWGWWELTPQVLAQWGKPTHSAPIMKAAIVRYALCSPQGEAADFVKKVRQQEPDMVRQQEKQLSDFEKKK